ncbi:sulfite exporter TauE/SafE family protein [Candidatus Omnitrophota bacterium]
MAELSLGFVVVIVTVAFFCEYMDSTLGMGYGTTLSPILLIAGYEPLQVVPAILISELISGLLAGILHHREGNVNFKPRSMKISIVAEKIRSIGWIKSIRKGLPMDLKVALLLAACSVAGTVVAVFLAINIPKFWVKIYIGVLVFMMGVIIIVCFNKKFKFNWKKIVGLGMLASFNKGISGGGYGPLVTSGQILSGVAGKSAVGITSLAEGLTCAVGIIAYLYISKNPLDLRLAPFIIMGAALSVPFSAKSVKRMDERKLKLAIAVLTIVLGLYTIIRTVQG